MNKKKAYENLIKYITEYMENGFVFHREFINEMKEILSDNLSGHENELFKLLVKQFAYVNTIGSRVDEADSNEKLCHTGFETDCYSLHLQNKTFNIRVLMMFSPDNVPLFLSVFYERAGKKTSDYSLRVGVAMKRYKELLKG